MIGPTVNCSPRPPSMAAFMYGWSANCMPMNEPGRPALLASTT
ncbi:hypothetical protein PEE19_06615 [Ralstonia solanacearum]